MENFWIFEVFCGNSDANQRCSANASQKAPHIIRASISASPFHFNPRLCRSFQSHPRKFRANSALALGAKHIRRSVSEASLMPSEFDRRNRIRSTKFFVEPNFYNFLLNSETPNLPVAKAIIKEVVAKPRMHDVARPPRPCRKGEGALATSGFTTASKVILIYILVCNAVGGLVTDSVV